MEGNRECDFYFKDTRGSLCPDGFVWFSRRFGLSCKSWFSLGDRIVLVDYLYERILSKLSPERINITHIGSIASSLVNLLPLAEKEGS